MKVLKYPEQTVTCSCGAELAYTSEDVKCESNFYHETTEYVVCPCCGSHVVVDEFSVGSHPYD